MARKDGGRPGGPAPEMQVGESGRWAPLQEGRYGAAWFVMLIGLMLVAFFCYSLVIENLVVIDQVTAPPNYGGPSDWASLMAPWLSGNATVIVFGSAFFLVGYSLTLRKKGSVYRGALLLRLFGACTGLVALFTLVLGAWYSFFLPKELSGFYAKLEFYGLQFAVFLLWGGILAAVTCYCWLPQGGDRGE